MLTDHTVLTKLPLPLKPFVHNRNTLKGSSFSWTLNLCRGGGVSRRERTRVHTRRFSIVKRELDLQTRETVFFGNCRCALRHIQSFQTSTLSVLLEGVPLELPEKIEVGLLRSA